ncbi:juvenile hormone acid O-methyltransferase-like [Spodoptera litura]|uniref:Juvenile hormone acid O-methyltransferase-like n=1 Tax=Spodoptera litura TaxID=69820 RepID=A0A9J7DQD8_SPOLT|nr:juvenile hormone acid O-methyltransferase-like [Spodoptera litura]
MNNPALFEQINFISKRDAINFLDDISPKLKWNNSISNVLDIGCGDGSVTSMLKKYIPTDFKLLGCDISEKMVNFANDHHSNEQTSFTVLDIAGDIPEDMKGKFDHVFSSYALHWVLDQERVFRNIYDLLSKDGECFTIFIANAPVYDLYRAQSPCSKWESWLKDVHKFISPYHDMQQPEKNVTQMMQEIGFRNIDVKCKEMRFEFDSVEAMKNTVKAIEPFNRPKDVYEEFMQDYYSVAQDIGVVEINNNNIGDTSINCSYSLLVVCASK